MGFAILIATRPTAVPAPALVKASAAPPAAIPALWSSVRVTPRAQGKHVWVRRVNSAPASGPARCPRPGACRTW
eukprot:3624091-Pyramimonas_sp.AAC.1